MPVESVFLYGEFADDRLAVSYRRAFAELGIQTHVWDTAQTWRHLAWPMKNRVVHRLAINSFSAREMASRQFNREFESAVVASKAQVLFILRATL